MNYLEEWTVVINKTKYVLNDKESKILKEQIARGNRGTVLFDRFSINIPYIEEFYLSGKYLDDSNMLMSENKYEVSPEEKKKVEESLKEFRKKFFGVHKVPLNRMTNQEINSRRNRLLDQGEELEKEK